MNRRDFLNGSAAAAAAGLASTLFVSDAQGSSKSPGESVTLAMIGVGGRGENLLKGFLERSDANIATICDVDLERRPEAPDLVQAAKGKRPKVVTDYRRVLEDKSIDAVVIATPDHWHCPLTVFSCQAGKDVYVEKPLSTNIWEGRKAVEAARKYGRVVQVGSQNRSGRYNREALEYIQSGKLGRVPLVRVCNLKTGGPYKEPPDSPTPTGVDYNLWLGPCRERPFNRGHFHKSWHFYWEYSGGDMANDGIHQLDLARWVLGKEAPRSVYSHGGNFAFDDDNETPDTQTAVFDFGDLQMVYEQIDYGNYILKIDDEVRNGPIYPYWMQDSCRIELYGTEGLMMLSRHGGGWQVYTRPQSRKPQIVAQGKSRFPDPDHKENFIQSIRSRERPSADVEEGHKSANLVHMANISYRLGRKLDYDPSSESFRGDAEANRMLKRERQREPFGIPEVV
jgi:predicted dehydrogenase